MPNFLSEARRQRRAQLALSIAAFAGIMGYGAHAAASPQTHTVTIEAMQFSPPALEVKRGDTIKWVNKDPFPHNAVADDQSFQSSEMPTDGTWTFKAAKPGTYPYRCTLHPTMKASIVVK